MAAASSTLIKSPQEGGHQFAKFAKGGIQGMCSCLHGGCCRLKMIAANGRLESDVTGAGRGGSITGEAIQSTSVKVVRAQHPALCTQCL